MLRGCAIDERTYYWAISEGPKPQDVWGSEALGILVDFDWNVNRVVPEIKFPRYFATFSGG
jgi:hypothetical protein